MDLKKKLKKFFTLCRRANAGFTLVELLVVIAVLSILGGIGTAGYSAYIKKATEAADLQIIAAVNTAFATACTEQNVKVDQVTDAAISLMNNKMNGISSVTVDGVTDNTEARKLTVSIAQGFKLYYKGNETAVFEGEGINSLIWNDAKDTFEKNTGFIDTLIILPNGNDINVSAADMEAIKNSSYAELGVGGITETIKSLNGSSKTLCDFVLVYKDVPLIGKDLTPNLTAVLAKYTDSNDLANRLKSSDSAVSSQASVEVANGLQMVVAEYIGKNPAKVDELEAMNFSGGTLGVLGNFVGDGGTKTCSGLAFQYAMATACSQTEYNDTSIKLTTGSWPNKVTGNYSSISECLNSQQAKDNPVETIEAIKKTDAYKNYVKSEQYTSDKSGFVASMGVVGKNLNNIGYDNYMQNGIEDENAQAVLNAAVGNRN